MAILSQLVKKIIGGIIMIFVIASFTFFLIHWMPGDPVQIQLNRLINSGIPENVAMSKVQSMYGFMPHEPIMVQYGHYLVRLCHLDLGQSITYTGISVSHLLGIASPWTLIMVTLGLAVSFIIGIIAGVIAAIWRTSWVGQSQTFVATLLHGIPQYMLALLLLYLFATVWKVFPFGGPYDAAIHPGWTGAFIGSLAQHAVLPVIAYAISGYGGWVLTMKSSVMSVLGDEFILAAELRGLTKGLRMRYIARNAFLPLFTTLTLSFGFMFGGSVFLETIYNYPGLGQMLSSSVGNQDYPLMSGAFLMITVAVILSNIIADLVYSLIDPRIRRA